MRNHSTTLRLLVMGLLLLVAMTTLRAQTRNRADNRGKEFRVAFLHTNGYDEYPRLAVVLASEKRTKGTITYLNSGKTEPVNLAPGVATWVDLDTVDLLLPDPTRNPISRSTVLLQFDDEVTLYGVNTQRWSSDVFLGLPMETIGDHYIVVSYPNTLSPDPTAIYTRNSDFPSQFAIVAMENNTVIDITPTTVIKSRPDDAPFRLTLNAGEVYFAQAAGKTGNDLTGTEIRSTKKIVVYGSHQRANIPFDDAVGRDHLVEQLLPVDRWPRRVILNPHYQIEKTVADANIVRIVAAENNTIINIDSTYFRTLNAREMLEMPLDRTALVTASGPIEVAQYQHSTVDEKFIRIENDSIGDPFMMLDFAQEQFDSIYWFESLPTKDFRYHYVNVIIPTERVSSFELDGGGYSPSVFQRIAKTSYSFAQIQVSPGPHRARARVPFGLYIYGYGPYNSYGYPGGIVFDTLFKDQKEPDIRWRDTCYGAAGAAFDDSTNDFGMESLRLLEGSENVDLELDNFKAGDDSIHFRLKLSDPYQDGYAQLVAVDTAGLDRHYSFKVKGFTVAMTVGQVQPILLDTLASLNGMEFCRTITLRNYGGFNQSVTGLRLDSPAAGLRVQGTFPVDIPPGEERQFSVCYQHVGDTAFTVQVGVENGCLIRAVATLPLLSAVDTVAPEISQVSEPCDLDRVLNVGELYARNSGVGSIEFLDSMNVDVSYVPAGLPSKQMQVQLKRRDPYQDMIYSIVVTDVVGNKTKVSDIVGGFTLAVREGSETGSQLGTRFNRTKEYPTIVYGDAACDTFYLQNYGRLPLTLQRPRILGNIDFSIPPEQLPLTLQPGQSAPLVVCVRPRGSGDHIDTFAVDFNCGNPIELVQLHMLVNPLVGSGGDRCGNEIQFQVDGFAKRDFLETPTPNPASGMAKITLGLASDQLVTLAIYDSKGGEVRRLFDNDPLPGGIAVINAAVQDLPVGMYYLRMETSEGSSIVEKLVISR
jgi:hypothetical protein